MYPFLVPSDMPGSLVAGPEDRPEAEKAPASRLAGADSAVKRYIQDQSFAMKNMPIMLAKLGSTGWVAPKSMLAVSTVPGAGAT